jgi:hypothetical protein
MSHEPTGGRTVHSRLDSEARRRMAHSVTEKKEPDNAKVGSGAVSGKFVKVPAHGRAVSYGFPEEGLELVIPALSRGLLR